MLRLVKASYLDCIALSEVVGFPDCKSVFLCKFPQQFGTSATFKTVVDLLAVLIYPDRYNVIMFTVNVVMPVQDIWPYPMPSMYSLTNSIIFS